MSYTIDKSYKARWYNTSSRAASSIKYIVLHYTGNGGTTATAKGNANYFKTTDRKASAHYVCDEKDVIYQCVPDTNAAYAVGDNQKYTNGGASLKGICTNSNSISIEMVSHSDSAGNYYISESTQQHARELARDLMKKYAVPIERVVRHYDVTGKMCPTTMCGDAAKNALWAQFKNKIINEEEEEVTQEQFNQMMNTYLTSLAKEDGSTWSEDARNWAIDKGIIKGDGNGNYQWKGLLTREQMAVMLQRLEK